MVLSVLLFQGRTISAWQSDNGDGTFTNPPLYADYPDPSIIRVATIFTWLLLLLLVCGSNITKSEDLVNWEIAGHCISSFDGNDDYNLEGTRYGNGCYAPP